MRPSRLAVVVALAVAAPAVPARAAAPHPIERRHEQSRCHDEDCDDSRGSGNGNRGYDGEGGRSGDTDQRGDRNCRNVCGNTIIVPMPGQNDQPPPEKQRVSLTNPAELPKVVAQIIQSALDMGRLFADTTIKFVSDLLVGLA